MAAVTALTGERFPVMLAGVRPGAIRTFMFDAFRAGHMCFP